MTYLLDTNVLSELRKGGRAHQTVQQWASRQPLTSLAISTISVLEIEVGILRIARRDRNQAERLNAWLHGQVRPKFKGRILPVDEAVALRAAQLPVPNPMSERDALIAATALAHGLVMVTRNTSDFAQARELELFDPWNGNRNAS